MAGEWPVDENQDEKENEDVPEDDVPLLPRWRTVHNANFLHYPEWQGSLPRSDDILLPIKFFRMFFF